MSIYNVIKKPVVTEKSQNLEVRGVYTIYVDGRATKVSVKDAVEKLYGVTVVKVNMVNEHPKLRTSSRRGGISLRRKARTKAYVTLQDGQRISEFQTLAS
ncbi:50S ribosomal protein L23 [Candidatus Peregrinibacteria bacterium]|jgi:large subunit ribosomal protein L23|nr:50S ribosomal protein L23 [Candidatus Peregrinibacteria bacterium]MCB9805023.1 50S ribosomal protein L23 [Candidatus Peribacteria bacterium]